MTKTLKVSVGRTKDNTIDYSDISIEELTATSSEQSMFLQPLLSTLYEIYKADTNVSKVI